MLLSQEQKNSFPYQEKILSPRRTDERQLTMHFTRTTLKNRQEMIPFSMKSLIFHLFRKSGLWNNERLPLLYVILFRIIFLHIFFQFGVPLPKHNYSLPSRKNFDFILLFILTRLGSGCSQTSVPLNLVENQERCSDARAMSKTLCYVQQ